MIQRLKEKEEEQTEEEVDRRRWMRSKKEKRRRGGEKKGGMVLKQQLRAYSFSHKQEVETEKELAGNGVEFWNFKACHPLTHLWLQDHTF